MKRTGKYMLGVLLIVAMLEAVVATVSAKAVGEGWELLGYPLGYAFIAIGIVVAIIIGIASMGGFVTIPDKASKPLVLTLAVIIIVGLLMVFVQTPAEVVEVTLDDIDFIIEAEPLTGAGYYNDTNFDSSSGHFTVPFRINDTTNTLNNHTINATYLHDPWMNFTIRADYNPAIHDDNDLAKCHFKVVNPSLYVGTDADNSVLTKDSDDEYEAWWTDNDGINSTLSGWVSGGVEETFWVNLQLNLYETGLAEATVLKPYLMTVEFYNPAGTWSEQFTVEFMATHNFN